MTTPSASPDIVAAAYRALENVWDPELGLDVVTMGLIYGIRVDESGLVIDMTLPTPGCPVAEQLPTRPGRQFAGCFPRSRFR